MLRSIVILLTLIFTTNVNADQKQLKVTQGNNDWALLVSGEGVALVGATMALVKFEFLNIENNPRYRTKRDVHSYRFGLATYNDDGRWYLAEKGPPAYLNKSLDVGHIFTMRDIKYLFELENKLINSYWLVIEVTLKNGETVYAHSRRDIFQ